MKVDVVRIGYIEGREAINKSRGIDGLVRKLARVLSGDGEGYFKSEDWPYIWSRHPRQNYRSK